MPFYRCNLSGGGGGVADCLADINEQLEGLGENEYLLAIRDNPTMYAPIKKTLTSNGETINVLTGGILVFDMSKITFNTIGYCLPATMSPMLAEVRTYNGNTIFTYNKVSTYRYAYENPYYDNVKGRNTDLFIICFYASNRDDIKIIGGN